MGAADTRHVLTVPVRLVADPTNLSVPFPYGGTALGLARDVEFVPNVQVKTVTAEEWGGNVVESYYCGEHATLTAVLRHWDGDAMEAVYPGIASGSSGTNLLVYTPAASVASGAASGATKAGTSLASLSCILLAVPYAHGEVQTKLPALIIYRAVPALDQAQRLQYAIGEEWGLAVAWQCTPDSSGRVYKMGKIGDLSL
jgi:hypothetical protein